MKTVEYGKENKDIIILLHGGGLSGWNYNEEAKILKKQFHIVVPILDGHSGSDRNFTTIEENARSLIEFIDDNFGGSVLLIGGLSLGGQILVEMLSQRKDICKYAVIESALVLPMKTTAALIKPTFAFFYPLIKKRWFAKFQFKSLHIKPALFDDYYKDTVAIKKEDMTAFLKANSDYKVKSSLCDCSAKTLVLVGGREQRIMKKSAKILNEKINNSTLEILPGFYHGDLSINHPDDYVKKLISLMGRK